jgi:hypothetical protein
VRRNRLKKNLSEIPDLRRAVTDHGCSVDNYGWHYQSIALGRLRLAVRHDCGGTAMAIRAATQILLMFFVLGTTASLAQDLPVSWKGKVELTVSAPVQTFMFASFSMDAHGVIPISVGPPRVTSAPGAPVEAHGVIGDADLPYNLTTTLTIVDCTGTVAGSWHATIKGDVLGTSSLDLTNTVPSESVTTNTECMGQNVSFPVPVPPLPPLKFQFPFVDQTEVPIAADSGMIQVTGKAKLYTACEGWDFSGGARGPKVTFDPGDPSDPTFSTPTAPHSSDYNSEGLTNKAAAIGSDETKTANGTVLGLTEVPLSSEDNWPIKVTTNQAESRDPDYQTCLYVDTISVGIPYLKIFEYVSRDLILGSACRQYVEDHETRHYNDAWVQFSGIASDIKKLAASYAGKTTAKPLKDAFDPTLQDYESDTIKKKIKDIIDARYKMLDDHRRALDAQAATEINDKCP